ncbi:DUF938 domain-containing protein [Altererythrobacter confluentis]|uniref:DUF938 domain-containing protein n=1 Tax=Allopontixanthobacter confluentis TaxID=1849021 RepID=A0A6L7GDB3_9SPHN|nr:DUF938 domain-containing protein [Allopontixanthobacter confluentis]MXP13580.1 DUF938 domain-containing protein [Allopontixanthobacter confluentis]
MKRHAPATARNSAAIAAILARELPACGTILEIASGTGEHAVYFAREFPSLVWQPSDSDLEALASINAWRTQAGLDNLLAAAEIDAASLHWPVETADAIVCINMVHISPWSAAEGLFRHAGRILASGAPLILYGPFAEKNLPTAPSNIAFDASLRQHDPAWGLRDVSALDELASHCGMRRTARHVMPANNLMLVYRKI